MLVYDNLYNYLFKDELKDVKPIGNRHYTWYDLAMMKSCKEFDEVLNKNIRGFRNKEIFAKLRQVELFMYSYTNNKKGSLKPSEKAKLLEFITDIQLADVISNATKDATIEEKNVMKEFEKFHNCLNEFLAFNDLEKQTKNLKNNHDFDDYIALGRLIDQVDEFSYKGPTSIDFIKRFNDADNEAKEEILNSRYYLSEENQKQVADFFDKTASLLDYLDLCALSLKSSSR